ncbi:MAG: hypothetical protein OXD33_00545 [Rhodobacteraceae bacterium]|nr:hypothetical protein [Paracoccaceae bacterium]
MPAGHCIVVVVDCDDNHCQILKARFEGICAQGDLLSRRVAGGPVWQVVTRIAVEELESLVFRRLAGSSRSLSARIAGYSAPYALQKRRRDHGRYMGAVQTGSAEKGLLQERTVQAAADIGKHFDPMNNISYLYDVL